MNDAIDWQNTVYTATDTRATDAANSASAASDQVILAQEQAVRAEDAAAFAESLSNFKGQWSDLSGPLNIPASVYHSDSYWALLLDLADVSSQEPGASSSWAEISFARVSTIMLNAPSMAGEQGYFTIEASATSLLNGGTIDSFVVTWWDGTTETVTATAGEATLSKAVDVPAGGTVSATVYAVDSVGNKSETKSASATVVDSYIEAPTNSYPADGAVDQPEQPILEASAFSVFNGTDTHESSRFRVLEAATGTIVHDSGAIAAATEYAIPAGVLQEGETEYEWDVQYRGAAYGWSLESTKTSFTTSASFIPNFETEVGSPYGGGYVAGKIVSDYDGLTYGLIVSDGSGDSVQMGAGTMNWRTSRTSVTTTGGVPPMTLADGRANHNAILALNSLAEFPAFKWIEDNCNAGAGLNGHTDWYLPSRDELEIIYRNFKPTTQDNNTGTRATTGFGGDGAVYGTNANSVPAGSGYTLIDPAQTADANFQAAGTDAVEDSTYWSSTENSDTFAWYQYFFNGGQYTSYKDNSYRVRAVRRIAL